jgi:AAA domain
MRRKYFRFSIEELEVLFKNCNDDQFILEALREELDHRKSDRAAKLRRQLSQPGKLGSSSILKQPSFPFAGVSAKENDRIKLRTEPVTPPPRPVHNTDLTSATLQERLKDHSDRKTPPITNNPQSILSAWTALEVLSPQVFKRPEDLASGDRTRVAKFGEERLPWERGLTQRLYYQIILGSVRMEPAIELLRKHYDDTRIEKPPAVGNAPLAIVIVDQQGKLAARAVAVSSFGWGVVTALTGELEDLGQWSNIESQLVSGIERSLQRWTGGDEDNREPITRAALMSAYGDLITTLGLPANWVDPPEFAIRTYTGFNDSPEPILLNSFFLEDLAFAKELFANNKAPGNLRRYLGLERPKQKRDLIRNRDAAEEAISPEKTPAARWPGPGRHSLVLLQQAAINIAVSETTPTGVVGVNGPPGTGKTTLLRDLVASVVTERAEVMAEYDDPEEAFQTTGLRIKVGQGWLHLYQLDESLRGFEIVVASSNNKAVENVSAELPGIDSIATDASDLRYFKTVSDSLHDRETWGLIAAVLGNAQNRSNFKQRFWWDDENALKWYLRLAAGSMPSEDDAERPVILAEEPPTTREEALDRWETAREKFVEVLEQSRAWRQSLETLRQDVLALPKLAKAETTAVREHAHAIDRVKRLLQQHQNSTRDIKSANEELRIHASTKPGFWARLFRTRRAREWNELQSALLELEQRESSLRSARSDHEKTKLRVREIQERHGVVIPDAEFFKNDHRAIHRATPWFHDAAQRARDDVFIAAMAVHRAFADAAAKPLKNNIGTLMNVFMSQSLPTVEKQALLPDLWSSLFLVVPLVSTTFASVNRMLGKLPPESLGWLLVDEAGQAEPQAAVGAIMRTRRAVMVGDPLQIEPIVMLPDTLAGAICRQFGVEPQEYAAPLASVQTLADAASAYMTEFSTGDVSRPVGVPLLVHRRCSEPMFTISNKIAYDSLMVLAKPKTDQLSDLCRLLGPSKWIDVVGSGEDKWCSQEGDEVVRMLHRLAQEGVSPDLYVITPFKIVAEGLRRIIRDSGVLQNWVDDERRWIKERVGTVHTAQGREAEAVIIVLGAPNPAQTGARNWAGRTPNILNVAVTRAKERVYVIGNRRLWREAGVFSVLDQYLS